MALDLLESYPELAVAPDREGRSPVEVLAGMSFAYHSGNRLVFWKQWIYNSEYHSLFLDQSIKFYAILLAPWRVNL